jgi:hypothetical protein
VAEVRSYHGQPVIKEPVWTWEIPCYFYTGGLAGASAGLAWLSERRGNDALARRAWAIALGGVITSPALLTSDLGKPMRFLNMLRMFKITSPMSVGSWVLSASALTTTLAVAERELGAFPRLGALSRPAAALLGLPLSTYTAALIANTAVPVWHEARRELPFVFAAGAAMSAGAAAAMATEPAVAAPARRLALAGAVAELATEQLMERRLGELRTPYEAGLPHQLAQLSRVTIAAGAALTALAGRRSRLAAVAGGALLSAGALATRWSIFRAGFASAGDPAAVIGPQRERIERGERPGAARRTARVAAGDPALGSPATGALSERSPSPSPRRHSRP